MLYEGNVLFNSYGVLQVVKFMHSKKILHNDIKSDNIVVADRVKLIDFGKETMSSSPLIDNIACGSADSRIYNTRHRHLVYELRNIPGSRQSNKTDTYYVGYMFKHAAANILYEPIFQLGRLMKRQDGTYQDIYRHLLV